MSEAISFLEQLRKDLATIRKKTEKEMKDAQARLGPAEDLLTEAEAELQEEMDRLNDLRDSYTKAEKKIDADNKKLFLQKSGLIDDFKNGKISALDASKKGVRQDEFKDETRRKTDAQLLELLEGIRGKELHVKRIQLKAKEAEASIVFLNSTPRRLEKELLLMKIKGIDAETSAFGSTDALHGQIKTLKEDITQASNRNVTWGRSFPKIGDPPLTPQGVLDLRFLSFFPECLFDNLRELHDQMIERGISVLEHPVSLHPARDGKPPWLDSIIPDERKSIHSGGAS